tara:strand:- start:1545 stop:2546 length:1002 start_codon:yes stop_codon:yes gene_type:complete
MQEIPEHIEALMAKQLEGSLSIDEQKELGQWLAENPKNRAVFEANQQIWESAAQPNAEAAWQKVSAKLNFTEEGNSKAPEQKGKIIPIQSWMSKAAAILALFAFSYALYQILQQDEERMQLQAHLQVEEIKLADNSIIHLNKGSILEYPEQFDEKVRSVKLNGEAFFEVERAPEKPFIIDAQALDVSVLGTSFFVDAAEGSDTLTVGVKSGKVAVKSKKSGEEHILTKGQKISYAVATSSFVLKSLGVNALFWQDTTLLYKQISLNGVLKDLSNKYQTTIVFDEANFENCFISARFSGKKLEEILDQISMNYGFRFLKTEEGYLLKGKAKCSP